MQLLVIVTVGYIIGIIWGLYFKISIVPMFFLLVGVLILFIKKIKYLHEFKSYFIICVFAIIISKFQIIYLENKFDTLYDGLDTINVVGIITSNGKLGNYMTGYILKIEEINGDTKYRNTYLNLYVKDNKQLEYGKKISFIRKL